MLVAEELECDWSKVTDGVPAPRREPPAQSHLGRLLDRRQPQHPQFAGAVAQGRRDRARDADRRRRRAVEGVAASECRAANSVITHAPSGRTVTFGAGRRSGGEDRAAERRHAQGCRRTGRLIGKPTRRLDVADKVQGKPIYGIDVRVPGMLYAAIAQCPVFKGTLKSVDETKIAGMKGVHKVVRLKDAVAVVADSWWQAKKALDALHDRLGRRRAAATSRAPASATSCAAGLTARDAGVGRAQGNLAEGFAQRRRSASRPTTRCRSSRTRRWSRRTAPRTSPATAPRSGCRRRTARPRWRRRRTRSAFRRRT